MENRLRHILLIGLLLFYSSMSAAQQPAADDESVMIEPSIERIEFDEALIDTEDFEILLALGYVSIEDFGVNPLLSLRLNYHINEDFFVQLAVGIAEGSDTSYELLSGGAPLLTDDEREFSYYNINIGYNLLPGEAFLGDQIAHNTAFYLSGGVGSTNFAGDDRFSINYGAGYRFLLNDAVAVYTDFRNNVFDMDIFGSKKATNNLEFTIGFSLFF